jgi:esterase/lipase
VSGLAALGALVGLGPRAGFVDRWTEPTIGPDVDGYLASEEAGVPGVRPGEAKSVVWARPTHEKTSLALVYLHGFSADRHEVEPLVTELAEDLGANAYFARLSGHGRDGPAMAEASVEDWLDDAAEAVAVGKRIGGRVVLLGTSTGGTLAVWTAGREEARPWLGALVLISPNLGPRDPAARFLLWPWGGLIARVVAGPERCFEPASADQARHWTTCYPTRALLPMMALVEGVRTMDLSRVTTPTLVMYSPNDAVVDPGQTERVMAGLGGKGPTMFRVDGSGDPENHVLAGSIMSPETTESVKARIEHFLSTALAARGDR